MLDFLGHIADDSARLASAARVAGDDADVPSCPGWRVRDLLAHIGLVHAEKELIVRERLGEPPPEGSVPGGDLVPWFEEGAARLIGTLAATSPSVPVWTWYEPDRTVGFWLRRMAHETLIHRVDAELSAGSVGPVDEALADDGVDELLAFMGNAPSWASVVPGEGSVTLVGPTRSWTVQRAYLSGTSPNTGNVYEDLEMAAIVDPSSDPNCAVAGAASALDLWLWGRGPLAALDVSGDIGLAEWLRRMAVEDTQ